MVRLLRYAGGISGLLIYIRKTLTHTRPIASEHVIHSMFKGTSIFRVACLSDEFCFFADRRMHLALLFLGSEFVLNSHKKLNDSPLRQPLTSVDVLNDHVFCYDCTLRHFFSSSFISFLIILIRSDRKIPTRRFSI